MLNHLIIAEIGSVHDGSWGNACKLIELAAVSGANAVKFQTHLAEHETVKNAPAPHYFQQENRWDYFKRTAFSLEQWAGLKAVADEFGLLFLSSPFSLAAVDLLEEINIPAYKIASGEVSNLPLLEAIAEKKKPVLLSSGMSNWKELDQAMACFQENETVVMQCSSAYPCPPEQFGLNVLSELQSRYQTQVGYSDHSQGFSAPIAAAALGAVVIEKHLTFSRAMYGSDAQHAMEPDEFRQMSLAIKETWRALKNPVNKADFGRYQEMKNIFEKSVVASRNIEAGEVIEKSCLAFKKPGTGIPAADYQWLIGKKAKRAVQCDELLAKDDFL